MKWLVTAFAPFGGAASNSSLIVLNHLRLRDWGGRIEFHYPVPVEFNTAWKNILEVLDRDHEITGLLAFGQAENRSRLGIEQVALNFNNPRIPDNAGLKPAEGPIDPEAPVLCGTNIPWLEFDLSEHSERSYSAGTYVCNNVMFHSLRWAVAHKKKAGFVHIPVLSSQNDPALVNAPRLDDRAAVNEAARLLEFLLKL